jgi:L-aspartate oxidase
MGGIRTDVDGRTNLPGLYSCGETAATGIHGANRLASNSLLEGLVFGKRIARAIAADRLAQAEPTPGVNGESMVFRQGSPSGIDVAHAWSQVQDIMWEKVGLIRTAGGLQEAIAGLTNLNRRLEGPLSSPEELQLANMATVGLLIARAALQRQESRGGHYRADFPQRDDLRWQKHIGQFRGSDRK